MKLSKQKQSLIASVLRQQRREKELVKALNEAEKTRQQDTIV